MGGHELDRSCLGYVQVLGSCEAVMNLRVP